MKLLAFSELDRSRYPGYTTIMDEHVHPRRRQQLDESGEPLSAEPEKLGPESRSKSFAEIAAILMNVPVPREDVFEQQPPHPPHEDLRSTPRRPEPPASGHAPATTPRPAIGAAPASFVAETPAVASRATNPTIAAPAPIRTPPMAPGIGGHNIDFPPLRQPADMAATNLPTRSLPDPRAVRHPPIRTRRKTVALWIGGLLFVVLLSAIVVDPGATLLTFLDAARKQTGIIAETATPPAEPSRDATSARPARLVVENQIGVANEPLPFGISLDGASGGETLTLAGLAAGTRLSAGTPLGSSGWLIPVRDIDKVLAYAPKDFVGVMDAAIDLRSASDQLIDSQVVRLEWIEKKKEGRPTFQTEPANRPPALQPQLNPGEIATLIERAQDFLKSGDIAAARISLKRAANAGSAQAALELGMTFDPTILVERGVFGLAPDAAQARDWYDKAMQLGSTEALRHLERLAALPK